MKQHIRLAEIIENTTYNTDITTTSIFVMLYKCLTGIISCKPPNDLMK